MKDLEIIKIRKSMEKILDDKRFEHTMGVAYTASALAMKYGENLKSAMIAGLLHDSAKCMDNDKKIAFCDKHNISITDVERRNPFLLHAKVGSFIAMDTYHISDSDIINAILNHNTGRPQMSLLEKIIYVADYIEPNRNQAPNLAMIRKTAFEDLDRAFLMILKDTLNYLKETQEEIDPMTQKTYEYYLNINTGKEIKTNE